MKRKKAFVPDRGDAVWISFDPQSGHEQAGRRPALVLSPAAYNERVGLAIMCPIASHVKGYPFEVALPAGLPLSGVVLADQVKCLDWRSRKVVLGCALPSTTVAQVLRKLNALLQIPTGT